jgi:RNA-directed DNA polymerase
MSEQQILSPNKLAWTLGVPRHVLESFASEAVRHYHPFMIERPGKKPRRIDNPDRKLKGIQRQIHRKLLKPFVLPEYLHGGIKDRSTYTNARQHLNQRMVIRLDLEDFFPSITDKQVYSTWSQRFDLSPPVASILTALTTYRRRLPQGAPTSSALANIALLDIDAKIQEAASQANYQYTRFVDDLVISGSQPQELINVVMEALREGGFGISRHKLLLMPANGPQEVTGLTVNSRRAPSVLRQRRERVRAAIHQLKDLPKDEKFNQQITSIRGRIAHFTRINPGHADKLTQQLNDLIQQD